METSIESMQRHTAPFLTALHVSTDHLASNAMLMYSKRKPMAFLGELPLNVGQGMNVGQGLNVRQGLNMRRGLTDALEIRTEDHEAVLLAKFLADFASETQVGHISLCARKGIANIGNKPIHSVISSYYQPHYDS